MSTVFCEVFSLLLAECTLLNIKSNCVVFLQTSMDVPRLLTNVNTAPASTHHLAPTTVNANWALVDGTAATVGFTKRFTHTARTEVW